MWYQVCLKPNGVSLSLTQSGLAGYLVTVMIKYLFQLGVICLKKSDRAITQITQNSDQLGLNGPQSYAQ
jgi:hypothetical protein